MQQTSKYQFNLIDSGDTFSTAPLNQNMEKVEAALGEQISALEALSGTLTAGGELTRIAWGSYKGSGTYGKSNPRTLIFDFTPRVVFIGCNEEATYSYNYLLYPHKYGKDMYSANVLNLTWSTNSVQWYGTATAAGMLNESARTYYYVAIGNVEA